MKFHTTQTCFQFDTPCKCALMMWIQVRSSPLPHWMRKETIRKGQKEYETNKTNWIEYLCLHLSPDTITFLQNKERPNIIVFVSHNRPQKEHITMYQCNQRNSTGCQLHSSAWCSHFNHSYLELSKYPKCSWCKMDYDFILILFSHFLTLVELQFFMRVSIFPNFSWIGFLFGSMATINRALRLNFETDKMRVWDWIKFFPFISPVFLSFLLPFLIFHTASPSIPVCQYEIWHLL